MTKEMIDSDGWLQTGDVGEVIENGALRLIDRKKNIFKLSQGEYVAPIKLENLYQKHKFVNQIFVHGESKMSFLVGLVVLDRATVQAFAEFESASEEITYEDLLEDPQFKVEILDALQEIGIAAKLNGYEILKNIAIIDQPFSEKDDTMTPTLKLRRV